MKLLILAALCLAALAKVPSREWLNEIVPEYDIKETSFRSGREYRFLYNGQLSTGIPMSSKQHSATRIQALVSLIFKTEEDVLLKVTHYRFGKLNRQLPASRAMNPFESFEEVDIEQDLQRELEAPIKFTWTKGLINDIVFDGIEKPWSANIKRGILNLLQVNLKKHREITSDYRQQSLIGDLADKDDFYRVTENTLEGECETYYTVTSQGHPSYSFGPVLNVTKSIDFERCVRRPEVKYNFRFSNPCPTCEETKYSEQEKFLKSSTVMKFNITGTPENFLIESARIESQYTVTPFDEEGNVIVTYVNQTLELVKTSPIQTQVSQPHNPKPSDSQMIFTPDWDIEKETFFMKGDDKFLETSPYVQISDKIALVKSLLRQFMSSIQESVDMESPRYFTRLVKVFRIHKREELEQVWESFVKSTPTDFTVEEYAKLKSVIVDAMAFAGTKETVFFLVDKIEKLQIDPIMAVLTLKAFTQIRVVSQEMIERLIRLAESETCRRSFFLKQTSWLTVGSLINALCVENEDVMALEFKMANPENFYCPMELKQKFVEKIFEHFDSASSPEIKVLYMKTLSNAALETAMPRLEMIIKNKDQKYERFIRTEAVLALRQLREIMPHKVRQILMPIYMNRWESHEMRILSLYTIFQTMPARPIIDQISRKLFSEKSQQVASFVSSYMRTMANSTNPCERRFATDLKLSLRHSRFVKSSYQLFYSKFIHLPIYFPTFKVGMDLDYASVWSNRSFVPRRMAFSFSSLFAGFWRKELLTVGFHAEGLEKVLWKYLGERGYLFERRAEELLRRSPRSVSSPIDELKSLYEKLNIRERGYFSEEQPKGHLYMKFKNQEFGFIPFNVESISDSMQEMISSGVFPIREIERFLEQGHQIKLFKAFFLHEMTYKIPTTLGMPLVFSARIPVVTKLTGRVKVDISPDNSFKRVKVMLEEFKPSFVAAFVAKLEAWSPIVNSGVKILAQAKVFTPLKQLAVEVNLAEPELKINYKPIEEVKEILHLESRPITFTLVWPKTTQKWTPREERTILGEEWTRVAEVDKVFGERTLGYGFHVKGKWHRTPLRKLATTPICPFSGPNRFIITRKPGVAPPKEYVLKLNAQMFEPLTESMKPQFKDFSSFWSDAQDEEYESLSPKFPEMIRYTPKEKHSHSVKLEIFTKGSNVDRKLELTKKVKCDEYYRYCNILSKLTIYPLPELMTEPFKAQLTGEILFPETPESFSELEGKKALIHYNLIWGQSDSRSNNFIDVKMVSERSEEQVEVMRQSPYYRLFNERETMCKDDRELCSPIQEYNYMDEHARHLTYRISIDYNNVPLVVKNVTNKFYRLVKFFNFFSTDVNQINIRNPENKIRAKFTLDPLSRQYFNLTIKTPKEVAIFRDIPIPMPVNPLNIKRSYPLRSSFLEPLRPFYEGKPTCTVSSRRIQTFDKVEFTSPLTKCWTVLAKDCGSTDEINFAVLAKKLREDETKKVKIVTRYHKIELEPESDNYDSLKLTINGEVKDITTFEPILEHGHEIVRVEKRGKYVKVELPETGVKVYFDGYTINIKVSELYRNVVCGLCGHFDYEPEDELRTANWDLTDDVREFHRSYIVKDNEQCQEYPEISYSSYKPFFYNEDKIQTQDEIYESEEPVRATKVLEHEEKLCFSKAPVPRCPRNTYPIEYKPDKKIVYTCLPRSSFEAQEYRERAERNLEFVTEVRELPSHFSETESIPKKCSKIEY